jgi:cytochrome c553
MFRRAALPGAAIVALLAVAPVLAGDGSTPQATARLLDLRAQRPISGDPAAGKAAAAVCNACHGERGIGVAPEFPHLAGQSATYLYVQLKTFHDGQRHDPAMAPMAAALGDEEMRNLAAWFGSLPPPQGRAAAAEPGGTPGGATLFRDGDPGRGIPPCQGCHGPAGQGPAPGAPSVPDTPHLPWSTIPRLQGQSATYLAKALHDFRDGARAGTSNAAIMQGVARTLSEEDIRQLADALSAD